MQRGFANVCVFMSRYENFFGPSLGGGAIAPIAPRGSATAAIISQSGHHQFSLKYHAFRRLLLDHSRLQTVPYNPVTAGIGPVRLDHQLSWEHLLDSVPSSPITLDSPVFMEHLNTRLGSG